MALQLDIEVNEACKMTISGSERRGNGDTLAPTRLVGYDFLPALQLPQISAALAFKRGGHTRVQLCIYIAGQKETL